MSNMKPVSDLHNYTEVLHEVTVGKPVFLTENGNCKYVILDIQDYEKAEATQCLMNELNKGRQYGEQNGWIASDDMRTI